MPDPAFRDKIPGHYKRRRHEAAIPHHPTLIMSILEQAGRLWRLAREVSARSGKSVPAQFAELLRLRFAEGRLGTSEYYDFQLWDDRRFPPERKREFMGLRGQAVLSDIVLDDCSYAVTLDKLTFYALMLAHRFPIPRIQAVYHEQGRPFGTAPVLRTPQALAAFIRDGMQFPFYAKPSVGMYGRANASVSAYDRTTDRLTLGTGETRTVDEFITGFERRSGLGWVFQEVLRTHPAIRDRCGERICGVRLQVILARDGPRVFRSMWKIATGTVPWDNYHKGREGNLLSRVNRATGRVEHVIGGLVPRQGPRTTHPDTGMDLTDFTVPCWPEIVETVLAASTVLHGVMVQGWDVAVTDRGPVLLECNPLGDADLSQFTWENGFLDAEFRGFLADHGLLDLLWGPAAPRQRNANTRLGRRKAHWQY